MDTENNLPIHFHTKKRTQYPAFVVWLGGAMLRLIGWKLVGKHPNVPKCVVACVPHTSNWDFPLTLLAAMALSLPCVFMIKDTLFWWPLGSVLRWLGGIPINRRSPVGIVDQMAQIFDESERLYVIITPEGTRKNVEYWKLGFYRIATKAGVPIQFGIINYQEKWVGLADLFYPTGNLEEDWRVITEEFQSKVGVTPKYRPKDAVSPAEEKDKIDVAPA